MALVSFCLLSIAFSVIYLVTKNAYLAASKSRIQESLTSQVFPLIAVTEDLNGELLVPEFVKNERLDHLNSKMVAYVFKVDGELIWSSRSSNTYNQLPDPALNYSLNKMLIAQLDGDDFFWVGDQFTWEYELPTEAAADAPREEAYLFLVGERKSMLDGSVQEYQRQVAIWLSISAAVLIIILVVSLNASLKPLRRARRQIELVGRGETRSIEGDFPEELQPLTSSINRLLASERLQRKRYRDALGNLAHSLKTPLTIVKTELENPSADSQQQIFTQVQRINDIVRYQLNRSVVTSGRVLNKTVHMGTEIEKIVDALKKVHREKNLTINFTTEKRCDFPGELGDLIELVGNLADNACKWADSKVLIRATQKNNQLVIEVADDGPGVPAAKRSLILDRGKRLDQHAEGQGLGLSIVMDIVQSYRGELKIADSQWGGSLFSAVFPV